MILLTGANGLIGSFIARKLVLQEMKVKALIRRGADLSLLEDIKTHIEFVEGDILDIPLLEKAMEDTDIIIHCAAIVSFGLGSTAEMYKVNVEGTKNVVNAALKSGIKRMVYLSSVAAIGRDPKVNSIHENTQWITSDLNSEYAKSKYQAELEVWRGIEEGLNAVILNPSIVLGPGDWNKSSTKIFKNMHEGMAFYPTGSVNVVDVRDIADAACLLLNSPISGERYIMNGHRLLYKDFFGKIATAFAKKTPSIKLTKTITLMAYYILRIFMPYYLAKRFINKETIVISNSHFHYENGKFTNTFNFAYRDLDETIRWTCEGLLKINKPG